ncbi:ShlB/FhaC/HecB family hemolysin secretion/activation protein [Leptothrix sp. BB-4]
MAAQSGIADPSQELMRQDRQRHELRERIELQPWSPSGLTAQIPSQQLIQEERPCALISRVAIQGVLYSEAMQKALSGVNGDDPPIGRCLGSQGVTLLIKRVQQALVEQGFITSHVHVPEQDLNSGELVLQISEGRVGRITQSHGKSADAEVDTTLPVLVWAVRAGRILNLRDIEQSSDNLQRLPSLKSKIQIEPGDAPGTSDLAVELQVTHPLRLALSVDDGGLKTSGKLQGNATLSWDNPVGLGDLLYFTKGQELGDKDSGPRGSRNQIVHYSVPWGYWLLGAALSDNQFRQTIYGPYESYLYSGTSSHQELSLSRVLHRNATSKTTASLKRFERQSNNYIADLEVLVQRRRTTGWEAGLQHLNYFESGTLNAQMAHRQGNASAGTPEAEGGSGQTIDRIRLTTGFLQWVMPLNTGGHAGQYSTQVQWQWAQTDLTPQDRFCLGSRAAVRGFDGQQTLCGDRGQLWRQELATGFPTAFQENLGFAKDIQVYVAIDAGRASSPGQQSAYLISGIALGFRHSHKVNEAYPLQWDIFVGKPLSHPDGFATARQTAGFALRAEY